MKLAHDAYSKGALALKAALLAPTLSILKTALDNGALEFAEAYIEDMTTLLSALCIFLFDALFNILATQINKLEIWSRTKKIDKEIKQLEGCLGDATTSLKTRINHKLRDLKGEKVSLISGK